VIFNFKAALFSFGFSMGTEIKKSDEILLTQIVKAPIKLKVTALIRHLGN
jgi:hypothetical protein